jgi:hypothetical protein
MSDNDFGGAKPMPVTGSGCGIRPSKEAMEVDYEVDFSKAKELLKENQNENDPSKQSHETHSRAK